MDENGPQSRYRGPSRPKSAGSDNRRSSDAVAATEVESSQLPFSKPAKADENLRNGLGSLHALRASSGSSKFVGGASSPQAAYFPSRPYFQDFENLFKTTAAEAGNEAVEFSQLSATVNGGLNPALASTLAQLYGAAINTSGLPEALNSVTDPLASRYLPPSFGSSVIHPSSSSPSSTTLLNGSFMNTVQFPQLSSLTTTSGHDSANPSSGSGIHSLLQQALALAYYQQCYRRYGSTSESAGGDIFSPEAVQTSQRHPPHSIRPTSPTRQFAAYRHPGTVQSCVDPGCVRCRLVETGVNAMSATKHMSTSSGSAADDSQCCISGCCCRQGAVSAQRHSPSSFNCTAVSASDHEQHRASCIPFASISGHVDSSSYFQPSSAAGAPPPAMTFAAVAAALSSLCRHPTDLQAGGYDVASVANGFSSADVHHRHVCSWLNASTGSYCGRRFATLESLLHHLQSHCVDQQPAPAAVAAASLLLAQQAAAAAAFQSTGNGFPSSLSSSVASGYPADIGSLLQMSRSDHFRSGSASTRSDGAAASSPSSRYHPYQIPSSYGATGAASRRHSSSVAGYETAGQILQSVCSESTVPRSASDVSVQQLNLLQRHRSLNSAVVAGGNGVPALSAGAMRL
jgi:hypothetical protein